MKTELYLGDCLEIMPTLKAGSVDLVLADPPYGTTACSWDAIIPFDKIWSCMTVLKNGTCPVLLCGSEPFSSVARMSNIKNYKYDWYFNKNRVSNPMVAKKQPLRHIENIMVFNSIGYFPQGLEQATRQGGGRNRHESDIGIGNEDGYRQEMTNYPRHYITFKMDNYGNACFHPTQKPVALMEYLIRTYSREGDTIMDFTMGSGTTGVACVNTGRNFVGVEKEPKYFKIAEKRIQDAKDRLGMFQ